MTTPNYSSRLKMWARAAAIVEPYRTLAGPRLPGEQHYCTFSGLLADQDGNLKPACELRHMVALGLIASQQYHGFERDPVKHRVNQLAVDKLPDAERPKLTQGDFVEEIGKLLAAQSVKPGIIHMDTEACPKRGLGWLADVLHIVNHYCHWPVMVVWNSIAEKYHHQRRSFRDEYELADRDSRLGFALDAGGWTQPNPHYEYRGAGGRTPMRCYTLWKG